MKTEKEKEKTYELKLTPQQKAEIRELTGKEAEAITLQVEELEERITPGWTAN